MAFQAVEVGAVWVHGLLEGEMSPPMRVLRKEIETLFDVGAIPGCMENDAVFQGLTT